MKIWGTFFSQTATLLGLLALAIPVHAAEPATPTAQRRAAEAAVTAEDWATAQTLYRSLTAHAPWNGPFWHRLGAVESRLGNLDAAIEAYLAARKTGHQTAQAAYAIAAAYVALEKPEAAVDWLNRATDEGLTNIEYRLAVDPRFIRLRENDLYKDNFHPILPDSATQGEKWRRDLTHLDRMYRLVHYRPFGTITEADWTQGLKNLADQAETSTNAQMSVGLMKLMARVGDGHSFVFDPYGQSLFGLVQTPAFFSTTPVEFYQFQDDIFVIGTGDDQVELLGGRVTRLGKATIKDAHEQVSRLVSRDNAYQVKWLSVRYLGVPEILHVLGLSENPGAFEIEVVKDDGTTVSMILEGEPYTEKRAVRAIPNLPHTVLSKDQADRPLTLRAVEDPFVLEWLTDERILFVQVNTIGDGDEETIEAFAKRIAAAIETRDPRAVVLDLRWNSGGDSFLNRHILNAVAGSSVDAPGRLFTIIGRKTYSAAVNLTSALKLNTNTLLVGEPSGAGPNFIGEINSIQLPNTGMFVTASSRYHQGRLSDDRDLWWTPDLPAEPTWATYRDGTDPAMTAIRDDLALAED